MSFLHAYLLSALAVAAPAVDSKIQSSARPLSNLKNTYVVDAETGITITVNGPAAVLLQLRGRTQVKRGILDIMRDDRYLSRNTVRFRKLKGSVPGFDFVTLLSWRAPAGTHTYHISGNGTDMVATVTATSSFLSAFAARPEEDTKASNDVRQPDPTPPPEVTPPPPDEPPTDTMGDIAYDLGSLAPETTTGVETTQSLGVSMTDHAVESRLNQADDALTIGGLVYPRFFFRKVEPVTPDVPEHTLTNSNLVDVYLDARPAEQVRGYVRMRLLNTQGVNRNTPDNNRFLLDQLWLKWNIGRSLYITLGKQQLRWGVGYFWNPSDILNPLRRDPLTPFDERTGLSLLKLHLPIESLGWNFYAIFDFTSLSQIERIPLALRGEFVFGLTEVILTSLLSKDNAAVHTAAFDAGIWLFDFKGEFVASQGPIRNRWTGPFVPADGIVPSLETSGDTWHTQASGGVELHIKYVTNDAEVAQDEVVIGGEYFHNDDGYAGRSKLPWVHAQGTLEPLYSGRDYAGAYILVPKPASWDETTFALSGVLNLSDKSWFTRFDYRVTLLRYLALDFAAIYHGGNIGTLRVGYDVPASPLTPGFEDGRAQATQQFDINFGIQIAL